MKRALPRELTTPAGADPAAADTELARLPHLPTRRAASVSTARHIAAAILLALLAACGGGGNDDCAGCTDENGRPGINPPHCSTEGVCK